MSKKPNFTEDVPEDLGGDTETQATYLPSTRQQAALLDPNAAAHLDMSGVQPPYLSIVHGVGELSERFNPGDLVLAKENLVAAKGASLEVVILNLTQYYRERVSQAAWAAGERPRDFGTLKEAADAGLQTAWQGSVGPDVSAAMDLVLMIRKPEGVTCGLFAIDTLDEGNEYALAKMTIDKVGYQPALQDVANTIKYKLAKSGVYSALWKMSTEMKVTRSGMRVQVCRFVFAGMLSEDMIRAIESAMGAPSNG